MKKVLVTTLFIILVQITCYSQNYRDNIILIKFYEVSFLDNEKAGNENQKINEIFSKNNVIEFKKAYPFAQNLELHKFYEIHFEGNIDSLELDINRNLSSEISTISKIEIVDTLTTYDPADYFWWLTTQDPNEHLWHLKKTQADLAWDITIGSPDIKIAILDFDFDVTHPDLSTKIFPHYDPFTNQPYSCNVWHSHGTTVASFVAAETIENGLPNNSGHLSSIGFNSMMIGYEAGVDRLTFLQKALHASTVMGANILFSCAGSGLNCNPNLSIGEDLILKEILDNGTVVIAPAGNGKGSGARCGNHTNGYWPFYPFNPSYDERVIIVSSTNKNDEHTFFDNGVEKTHSHFPEVDLCAPGYQLLGADITNCGQSQHPYFHQWGGTSFSTPIVAGAAALVLAVNPCLMPEDIKFILKSTTDPILDAANYPGMVGTGRLNAYQAVMMAQNYGEYPPVTVNTIWNDEVYVKGNLVVKQGATLTIKNKVRFSENSKIIIEPGAMLILDGGHLTNSNGCRNSLWQGIEVWGNTNLAHTDANQGVLEVKNGSIIENAINAVTTWKPNDWSKSGGIIRASNSTFRENKRSVEFRYYPNYTNTSYFDKCTFINTRKYNDGTMGSGYMVTMENVSGVKFRGCDFEDSNPEATIYTHLKSGIAANDSYFEVEPYCLAWDINGNCTSGYQEGSFTNLNFAVRSEKASGNQTYKIDRTNFNDCVVSVLNMGTNNAIITRNNFSLGNTQPAEPWSIGIHIQTGIGFTIEENTISRTGSSSSSLGMFGIALDNLGSSNNMVYKNTFNNLDFANYSIGINAGMFFGFAITGIEYRCNLHYNTVSNDILVNTSSPPVNGESIKYLQGASNLGAGNLFTPGGSTFSNIDQNNSFAIWYYYNNTTNHNPVNKTANVSTTQATANNSCPSNFGGGGSSGMMAGGNEEEWETQFAENLLAYNTYSIQYQSLLDGGNTQLLKQEVEQTTAQTAFQTAQELTVLSPFVSEDVLKKVIEKEDIINNALLFDILISNPDGLRSEEVQELLNNKQNPLPQWMISLLEDAQGNISAKTLLQIAISTHRTEIDLAVSKLVTEQMTKPLNANKDSLYMRLDMAPTMLRVINKSDQWIRSGNISGLQNHLTSIENNIDLSENELQSLSDFKDYAILLTQAYQTGLTPYNLDSSYISQFKEIADTYSEPSATLAGNILHNYGFDYYRPPIIEQQNKVQKSSKEETKSLSQENNFFKIVPNPARGYFALQWKQDDLPKDTYLSVYDLTGKPIFTERIDNQSGQKIVSTQKWQAGTYIVEVSYKKKKVIYSDKVLVVGE